MLSVPAYGINIHSEREVVLIGSAFKSWDAWHKKAPPAEVFPINDKNANKNGLEVEDIADDFRRIFRRRATTS